MPTLGQDLGSSCQSREVFLPPWSGGNGCKEVNVVKAKEMNKVVRRARLRWGLQS